MSINPVGPSNGILINGNEQIKRAPSSEVPNISGAQGSHNYSAKVVKYVSPENRMDRLIEIYGEKALKQMGVIECSTCSSRTYVDGSDDAGVSFKSPTHVSPEASFQAVASHEQEHVTRERAKADANEATVVRQSVQIFTSVCPECGRRYASGGVTKTTTMSGGQENKYNNDQNKSRKTTSGNLLEALI